MVLIDPAHLEWPDQRDDENGHDEDWNNSDEQVTAIGQAVLTRPDVIAKADKMITDKQFAKSKLIGNASVVKKQN